MESFKTAKNTPIAPVFDMTIPRQGIDEVLMRAASQFIGWDHPLIKALKDPNQEVDITVDIGNGRLARVQFRIR